MPRQTLQERMAMVQNQGQSGGKPERQVLAQDHGLSEQDQDRAQRALGMDATSLMSILSRWGPVAIKVIQEILGNLPAQHQVGQSVPKQALPQEASHHEESPQEDHHD